MRRYASRKALKTLAEGGESEADRINYAFRRCVGRKPDAQERKELEGLLRRQQSRIAEGWVNASELATGSAATPVKVPEGHTPTELAAYVVMSRVLLNLDETITRE